MNNDKQLTKDGKEISPTVTDKAKDCVNNPTVMVFKEFQNKKCLIKPKIQVVAIIMNTEEAAQSFSFINLIAQQKLPRHKNKAPVNQLI